MLLECFDDDLVGRLNLVVGLWVVRCGVVYLDPSFFAEVLKLKADEL